MTAKSHLQETSLNMVVWCVVIDVEAQGELPSNLKYCTFFSPSFRSGCALSNPEELIIGTDFYPEHMTYRDQPGFFFLLASQLESN